MRNLYQCSNAIVKPTIIICKAGHEIAKAPIDITRLKEGSRLEYKACQNCADYDCMGPPVPRKERGWLNV